MKRMVSAAVIVLLLGSLLSGCARTNNGSSSESAVKYVSPSSLEAVSVDVPEPSRDGAVTVRLNGNSAEIDGVGAVFSDGVVTVTEGGVYVFCGDLSDGKILVNAHKKNVSLIFEGVSLSCSNGSPLYVYKANEVLVYLPEGTVNTLSDGSDYAFGGEYTSIEDDEPNACVYSKADLVIAGSGALSVKANYKNGITGKDVLKISGCKVDVSAVNHGVNGKDSLIVSNASITITAANGDGLRSTNDTDAGLGCVSISGSEISVVSASDGIQAVTSLAVFNSAVNVVSGGGSSVPKSSDSAKGIKSDGALLLDGGEYDLDCSDDAVHANGDVLIRSGAFSVSSADDAFHADKDLVFSGGSVTVAACKEGYEGLTVTVSGGTHSIVSTDDGINASAGKTSARGFGRNEFQNNENCRITIEGGSVTIMAGGDGVDSNGSITMSGGSLIVSSTGNADGALDFNGSMSFTGGYLLAATGGGMPEAPGSAQQPVIVIGLGSNMPSGSVVTITTDSGEYSFELPVNANHVVFSSPELRSGESVTVDVSGTVIGSAELTEGVVTVGTVNNFGPGNPGSPGNPGNPGGRPGGFPGGGGNPGGYPPGSPGRMESPSPTQSSGSR